MNRMQRAVVEAAKSWAADSGGEDGSAEISLRDAVAALVAAEQRGSLDELCDWIVKHHPSVGNDGSGTRAVMLLRRNVERSGGVHRWDASQWPVKVTTAGQFAELDAFLLRDARGAGPKTWTIWAAALRAIGIEPRWAAELGC